MNKELIDRLDEIIRLLKELTQEEPQPVAVEPPVTDATPEWHAPEEDG